MLMTLIGLAWKGTILWATSSLVLETEHWQRYDLMLAHRFSFFVGFWPVVRRSIARQMSGQVCCMLCHDKEEARADASEDTWSRKTVSCPEVVSLHMVQWGR